MTRSTSLRALRPNGSRLSCGILSSGLRERAGGVGTGVFFFFPVNFLSLFGRKTNVGLGRGGGGGGGGRLGLETLGLASGETHPEISHSPTDADFSLQSVAAFLAARPLCAAALGFRYRKRTEREREREKEPFCLHLATPTAALLLIPPPPLQNPSSPLGPSLSLLYWPSQSSFFPSDNPPHHHLLVLLSAFSPF